MRHCIVFTVIQNLVSLFLWSESSLENWGSVLHLVVISRCPLDHDGHLLAWGLKLTCKLLWLTVNLSWLWEPILGPSYSPSQSWVIDSSWNLFVICSTLKIHSVFLLPLDLIAAHFSSFHIIPQNSFTNILCVLFSCLTFTAHSQLSRDPYSLQELTWHLFVLMTTVAFLGRLLILPYGF